MDYKPLGGKKKKELCSLGSHHRFTKSHGKMNEALEAEKWSY